MSPRGGGGASCASPAPHAGTAPVLCTASLPEELSDRRDLFPLPELLVEGSSTGRRGPRRRNEAAMVNDAVRALNEMCNGRPGGPRAAPARSPSELRGAYRDVLLRLLRSVRELGAPPPELTSRTAREELSAMHGAYAHSGVPGVGERAALEAKILSLPAAGTRLVRLSSVLDGEAGHALRHFEESMLVDGDVWAMRAERMQQVVMFTDPSLTGVNGELFVVRLLQCGIAKLCLQPRSKVGVFAVGKKPNASGRRQRLIVDCRRANALFKDAPYTELGGLDSIIGCELEPHSALYWTAVDIKDCFYESGIEDELAEHFSMDLKISAGQLRSHGVRASDFLVKGISRELSDEALLTPCFCVLLMGFTWSFWVVQQLHTQYMRRALIGSPFSLVVDGYPGAPWALDQANIMALCDNLNVGCCTSPLPGSSRHRCRLHAEGRVRDPRTGWPHEARHGLGRPRRWRCRRGVPAPASGLEVDLGAPVACHPPRRGPARHRGLARARRVGDGHPPWWHERGAQSLRLRGPEGKGYALVARSRARVRALGGHPPASAR